MLKPCLSFPLKRLRFCLRSVKNKIVNREFKVLIFRMVYTIVKRFNKKKIWLISDRTEVANDNGIHLFKYIVKQNNKVDVIYFVFVNIINFTFRIKFRINSIRNV